MVQETVNLEVAKALAETGYPQDDSKWAWSIERDGPWAVWPRRGIEFNPALDIAAPTLAEMFAFKVDGRALLACVEGEKGGYGAVAFDPGGLIVKRIRGYESDNPTDAAGLAIAAALRAEKEKS